MNINSLLFSILSVALPVSGLAADPRTRHFEDSSARALKVQPMPGRLRVSVGATPGITLVLSGPARIVDQVRVKVVRGTLVVEPPAQASGSTVYIEKGVTVIARDGGAASVTIGGADPLHDREPPLEVLATVPLGASVDVLDLAGSAEIGDTEGPVKLTISAGAAAMGHIGNGVLTIDGSGDITAAQVVGSLRVDLSGSGGVTVEQAELNQLDIELSGSGDVRVNGRAERAALKLTGAGQIEVSEVVEQPSISLTGAGEVIVGNW